MPVNVLQLTDMHLFADKTATLRQINTAQSFEQVLEAVIQASLTPDIILLTGDLTQLGEATAYRYLIEYMQPFTCPIYAIPGNHDDPEVLEMTLTDSPISLGKSIILGGWHIILLDSVIPGNTEGRLSAAELRYLQQALARYSERPTVIALHHHVLPVSGHMDTIMLTNTDEFFATIDSFAQVKTVVSGHVHQAFAIERNGVRYLTSPSTCYQIEPAAVDFTASAEAPGYRWLILNDDATMQTIVQRA